MPHESKTRTLRISAASLGLLAVGFWAVLPGLTTASPAQRTTQQDTRPSGAIVGQLLDIEGAPIQGQVVELASPREKPLASLLFWKPVASVETDAAGSFRFNDVAPGTYDVGLPPRTRLEINEDQTGIVRYGSVTLTDAAPNARVPLQVELGHFIEAQVKFPDRWSAKAPWLIARGEGGWSSQFTPSQMFRSGPFDLGPFPQGTVSIEMAGAYSGPPLLELRLPTTKDEITLELPPALSLRGAIIEGGDMVRSRITVCARHGEGKLLTVQPRGIFFYFNFVPCKEPVTVYGLSTDGRVSDPVELPEDLREIPRILELRLRPACRVRLVLDGAAPDGIEAVLVTPSGFESPQAVKDEDGDGVLELLGPEGAGELQLLDAEGGSIGRRALELVRGTVVEVRFDPEDPKATGDGR